MFNETYKLEIIQWRLGNSQEQQQFRDLRDGESTLEDWYLLTTRFEGNVSRSEQDRFKNSMFMKDTEIITN